MTASFLVGARRTGPRKVVAQHIIKAALEISANTLPAALEISANTLPMDTFRSEARRLARRTIAWLERQGYRPADIYGSPEGLAALRPIVVALSTQPIAVAEPEPRSLVRTEAPSMWHLDTLPWKWVTFIALDLVRHAVLIVNGEGCVFARWGDEKDAEG